MADNVEEFLAQAGVKGMKWGHRKASSSVSTSKKRPKKKPRTEAEKKEAAEWLKAISLLGAAVAVNRGANWAYKNPQKVANFIARTANVVNGTKAIGPGYEVAKLAFRNGVWG